MAVQKDYVLPDGEQCGEIVGPKLQGNPYGLTLHLWYPFSRAIQYLSFRSFHEHARTFENWSSWFRDHLKSRFSTKLVGPEQACLAEGVVFYNLKRRAAGASWMAKLRRDMFDWYYPDLRIAR